MDLDKFAERMDAAAHDPATRQKPSLDATLKEIRFHAKIRYWQFTPCYGEEFEARLARWISNDVLGDQDREALLRLVPELGFIDRDDMMILYQSAFSDQVCRWIMDQVGLDFTLTESALTAKIKAALQHTWICPLTDSLDIGQFHHVNNLSTHARRPQWRTLSQFGSLDEIQDYIEQCDIRRLVILEDIVGSGTQSGRVLDDVVTRLAPHVPILFVPLIVSKIGLKRLERLLGTHSQCFIMPVMTVPEIVHVRPPVAVDEPAFVRHLRPVIRRTARRFGRYAFGYKSVGSLIVLYTNCPDLVPRLIWYKTNTWSPLFPRVSRPGD